MAGSLIDAGCLQSLKWHSGTIDIPKMLIMVKGSKNVLERKNISEGQTVYRMLSFHYRRVAKLLDRVLKFHVIHHRVQMNGERLPMFTCNE